MMLRPCLHCAKQRCHICVARDHWGRQSLQPLILAPAQPSPCQHVSRRSPEGPKQRLCQCLMPLVIGVYTAGTAAHTQLSVVNRRSKHVQTE
jgi:hypothetical protein